MFCVIIEIDKITRIKETNGKTTNVVTIIINGYNTIKCTVL